MASEAKTGSAIFFDKPLVVFVGAGERPADEDSFQGVHRERRHGVGRRCRHSDLCAFLTLTRGLCPRGPPERRTCLQRSRSRPVGGIEAVADAGLGVEVAGPAGHGLELAADVGQVHAQVVRSRPRTVVPTPRSAAAGRDQPAPSPHQGLDQAPLGRRQLDLDVVARGAPGGEVEPQRSGTRSPAAPRRRPVGAARPAAGRAVRPSRTAWRGSRRRRHRARRSCRVSVSRADRTMIGTVVQRRSARITSSPLIPGSPRSSRTTSGRCSAAACNANSPVVARVDVVLTGA